jgi:aminomethyltransferase
MSETSQDLLKTPLFDVHERLGARMVPFAGYALPVQYTGIMDEHKHCRAAAGLFDVSHMGQVRLSGDSRVAALENLVPGDIAGLAPGQMRYSQLTNDNCGILDDLMITNMGDHLFLVVNGACKTTDLAHMQSRICDQVALEHLTDRALLALQGPEAATVLARLTDSDLAAMVFMTAQKMTVAGISCLVSRAGYTGEDGFELSVANEDAAALADKILAAPEVKPIGLGARDSLRLEAGLCLYGHDLDETTTPAEAALMWSISKRRREEGGFPGAQVLRDQLASGTTRKRVGILPDGRAPAREGAEITNQAGDKIGVVTSGGFGPSFGGPVAMGYVETASAKIDTNINLIVRGKALPAKIAKMPFVPQRYYRG